MFEIPFCKEKKFPTTLMQFLHGRNFYIDTKSINKVYEKSNCASNNVNFILYAFETTEFYLMKM